MCFAPSCLPEEKRDVGTFLCTNEFLDTISSIAIVSSQIFILKTLLSSATNSSRIETVKCYQK